MDRLVESLARSFLYLSRRPCCKRTWRRERLACRRILWHVRKPCYAGLPDVAHDLDYLEDLLFAFFELQIAPPTDSLPRW